MSRGRFACVLVVALAVVGGWNLPASAGLSIVSDSIKVDRADQTVFFDIVFNQAPDFKTVDSFGRHADAFQYEIVPNTNANIDSLPFGAIRAVVRGDEIGGGHVIPIRDGFEHGASSDPTSGGWGAILGKVPFTLQGPQLAFSAPFDFLGTTDGHFTYRLFTTNYGSTVSQVQGVSVPLPPAFPIGVIVLFTLGMAGFITRRVIR